MFCDAITTSVMAAIHFRQSKTFFPSRQSQMILMNEFGSNAALNVTPHYSRASTLVNGRLSAFINIRLSLSFDIQVCFVSVLKIAVVTLKALKV